jgi:Zn finger protein HypA/HybF involved in hydrogenase expression
MTRSLPSTTETDRDDVTGRVNDVPKSRKCLTCRGNFLSEWVGQRVCPKCKKKNQWRSGALRQSF